jgi:hypothetical protein
MSRKSDLVSALEAESETLQNITDYFVPLARHFRIFYFWEQARTRPPPLLRKGLGLGLGLGLSLRGWYVVAHESAVPAHDDEAERAAIAADHRGMVRFETPSAQGFRMVADALVRYCTEAGEVVRQRRVEAARELGVERSREAAEVLRSVATAGVGAGAATATTAEFYPRGVVAQDMTPLGRADSMPGSEEWLLSGKTETFHSLGAFDEV